MDASAAWQAKQFITGHANQRAGALVDIHGIEQQQARSFAHVAHQLRAQGSTVDENHSRRDPWIHLQAPEGVHAKSVIGPDNVADSDHDSLGDLRRLHSHLSQTAVLAGNPFRWLRRRVVLRLRKGPAFSSQIVFGYELVSAENALHHASLLFR